MIWKCSCGRSTTLGPKCVFCAREKDEEKEDKINWKELEKYIDCEDWLEEEED